jgi:hypothetical protein
MAPLLILANLCCLLGPSHVEAEGTKQVMPNSGYGTGLIVSTTTSFPLGNVGSYLGAPVDQRLYIRIKDYTIEKIYYAFHWEALSPSSSGVPYTNVYMRIYDPTGTQVGSPIHMPTSGAGYISTYNQSATPNMGGPAGSSYPPLIFDPNLIAKKNGDYYVSFYQSNDNGATDAGESMLSKWFDISVVPTGGVPLKGRIHCNLWAFSVYNVANDLQEPTVSTFAQFYGYTPDSVTVKVSFPSIGFQPLSFLVAFNDFGVADSGNWVQNRRSIVLPKLISPYLQGGYPTFLNPPDPSIYPACVIPSSPVLLAPVIAGCPPGPYNVRFEAPQDGDYYMLFDLNGVPEFQNHTADLFVELVGQKKGVITFVWDGKDGLGNIVPANITFPIIFSFRKGRINIPFYDVELNLNGFQVDGISPAVPGINSTNTTLYWDDTKLYNRGNDCGDNNNNTTGTGYDNSVIGVKPVFSGLGLPTVGRAWSGNGNPTNVTPAPAVGGNDGDAQQCDDFGNARLLNTWAWGLTLPSTQTVTLSCITVSGTVWDDANGSANGDTTNIYTAGEAGVNAGGTLYANLVDPITNNVLSSMAVNANGTYTLLNCPVNASGMLIYITTSQVANGSQVPAPGVSSAWINTSPLTRTFSSHNYPITGQDFGIEQLPNSADQNYTIATPVLGTRISLNGAGTIASPGPLFGSDPEDGALGSNRTVVITSIPSNEQLFYNNLPVTDNFKITNYDPSLLQMQFTTINSTTSTSFTYAYVDAAGKQDPSPATYTINLSTVLATTLGTFTGRSSDYGNVLNWTSYQETPDIHFIVQRSVDGTSFMSISTVAGTGNGTTVNHAYTDNSPSPNTPTYYRLEWTDGNGNIAYSNVVTIAASASSAVLDVSPNPFSSQVTVRLNLARAERVAIRLLDSKGMLLKQAQYQGVKGTNSLLVNDLSSLPPSVYFVQIVLADRVFVKKVFNQ